MVPISGVARVIQRQLRARPRAQPHNSKKNPSRRTLSLIHPCRANGHGRFFVLDAESEKKRNPTDAPLFHSCAIFFR
jgi:hypothetical protein